MVKANAVVEKMDMNSVMPKTTNLESLEIMVANGFLVEGLCFISNRLDSKSKMVCQAVQSTTNASDYNET